MQILAHTELLCIKKNNEVIYFDSFGVEYIPKEIKKFTKQNIIKQTYLEFKHTIQ